MADNMAQYVQPTLSYVVYRVYDNDLESIASFVDKADAIDYACTRNQVYPMRVVFWSFGNFVNWLQINTNGVWTHSE